MITTWLLVFFCDDNTLIWPIYCFCVGNISVLFTLPPSHVTGLATFGWATVVLVSAGRLWPAWWPLAGAPLHWSALGASDRPGDLCHSGVPVLQHTDCGPLTFPGSPGPDRVKLYNFFSTQVSILLSTIWYEHMTFSFFLMVTHLCIWPIYFFCVGN